MKKDLLEKGIINLCHKAPVYMLIGNKLNKNKGYIGLAINVAQRFTQHRYRNSI